SHPGKRADSKMKASSLTVVKVGGSLFDIPALGAHLRHWLARLDGPPLIVPGGGPLAEALRELDHIHHLGEEASHWLALRAMSINAYFLCRTLEKAEVIRDAFAWQEVSGRGLFPILDAHCFALADEERPGRLPHSWDVTSDSIAARVAV